MKRSLKIKTVATLAFLLGTLFAGAQNLVLNPGLESVNSGALQCSWYTSQSQFNSAINNWTCPTGGSSDIFSTTLATSCFSSPNSTNSSGVGTQAPHGGNAMVGGFMYGSGGCTPYREYVQGNLSSALVAGTNYKIELYVSLGDNCNKAISNIGMKFSVAPVNVSSMCVYSAVPDVNYTGTPITDKINWTKLEFCYTPTASGLIHFMIGNFFSDVATPSSNVTGSINNAYYYIDDVSIVPSPSTAITPTVTSVSNCSSTTTTLNALPASVNYTWTAPSGGTVLSGLHAQNATVQGNGIYTLSIQNPTACVNSVSTTTISVVTATASLTPTITGSGTITCTTPTLALSCSPTTGVTYTWTGSGIISGVNSSSVIVNAGGNYSVTVANTGGCSGTASTTVFQNITPPVISLTPASTTISCASPTVQLTSSINPSSSTYTWAAPSGGSLSSTTVNNPVASGNGVFTLTATSPINGCVNTSTASLLAGPSSVTLSVASVSICSGQIAALTVSGNAASYSWAPSTGLSATTGSAVTASPASTTSYSVIGTNAACSATTIVTVTVMPVPNPAITPANQSICNGQTAAMLVSGGSSYTWSPAGTLSTSTGSNVIANPTVTTVYSVLSGAGTCTALTQATVNVVNNPNITIIGDSIICAGTSTPLTAYGVTGYTWSPAVNLSTTTGSATVAGPPSTTTYTINGGVGTCTAVAYVTITVTPLPTLTVSPAQTLCSGSSATLTASGASGYTWTPAASLSSSTGGTVVSTSTVSTTYTVTGINGVCTSTAAATVNVNAIPSITINPNNPSVCLGSSTNLTASGASSYTWAPSTGLNTTLSANVTASPAVTTIYTVQGNSAGCFTQTSVTVSVNPNPVLTISPDATICSGSNTNLTVGGASSYTWTPMTGLTTTNGINVVAAPAASNTYMVTGAMAGCTGTITVSVNVIPTPTINATASPTAICQGKTSSLNATGATAYVWGPAATLTNINANTADAGPLATTVYTVTGTNGVMPNQCTATQTVEVTVTPTVNIVILPVKPICFGESASIEASGATSYTWIPTQGVSTPNQASSLIKPNATTVYTLTAGSGGLCTSQATVQVIVNALPHVYAGADTTVNIDESVTLHGTGNVDVEFLSTSAVPLNCNFCNSVTVNPQEKTCYTLRGTSSAGCVAYDDVCVNVTKDWNIYIPNAFTPNGDADNDVFVPVGYGITQIKLFIFDRWGTQIFAGDDANPGWDGKLKGKFCEQGVYVYQVEIKTMSGNTIKKVGHVTLLAK